MKKYNHINAPYSFKEFYSKYPQGYTIYEALLDWLEHVNSMSDTLNTMLEVPIEQQATALLSEWEQDGTLDAIIDRTFNQSVYINVLMHGLKGDGVTDDSPALQQLVNEVSTGQRKGVLFFPMTTNFYKLSNIIVGSNVEFVGDIGKPLLKLESLTDNAPVFSIVDKENIKFSNLKIQNGQSTTGLSSGSSKNGVSIFNSNHIDFTNCDFIEIGGHSGVLVEKSGYLNFTNCLFYKQTYSGLMLLPETHDVVVDNCVFDTATSLQHDQTYLFATGSDSFTNEYTYSVRDITLRNSKFLNNPRWEGIDFHSGENLLIENNYVENVGIGIMISHDSRFNWGFHHGNITIRNNIIYKGASTTELNGGILVRGEHSGQQRMAQNVLIEGNRIEGDFGIASSNYNGSLYISHLENFTIKNNVIKGAKVRLMYMIYCINGVVSDNRFIDVGTQTNGISFGVEFGVALSHIYVKNNIIKNETKPRINTGIRSGAVKGLVYYENNMVDAIGEYNVNNALMKGFVHETYKCGKRGVKVHDTNGLVTHYCTDTIIRSTATAKALRISGESNSTIVTTSTPAIIDLVVGEEFTIAGAGADGGLLTCIFKRYIDKNTIEIDTPLLTSVNSAVVSTLESTWVAV